VVKNKKTKKQKTKKKEAHSSCKGHVGNKKFFKAAQQRILRD
jgi:hypothetical protein